MESGLIFDTLPAVAEGGGLAQIHSTTDMKRLMMLSDTTNEAVDDDEGKSNKQKYARREEGKGKGKSKGISLSKKSRTCRSLGILSDKMTLTSIRTSSTRNDNDFIHH